jgi:hypothetical protein
MTNLQDMFDDEPNQKFRKISDETRAKMSASSKGQTKTSEHRAKITASNTEHLFKNKTVKEWAELLKGDRGEIRKHIKNGTMEQYSRYCEFMGLEKVQRSSVKQLMTPKGIMTYAQAKEAFGWSQAETVRKRVHSDDFPDWYEI